MKHKMQAVLLALAVAIPVLIGCSQPAMQAQDKKEETETMGQKIEDATMTAKIKTTYLFNPHLNSFRINVDTVDGDVTLQGVVKTGIQKDLAGEIAKNASGVNKVHNRLQVSEGAVSDPDEVDRTFSQAALDATTTASVKMALALARGVKASDINVSTRWGTVTLTGEVGSKGAKKLAEKTAEKTDGVKDVVNKIEVRS